MSKKNKYTYSLLLFLILILSVLLFVYINNKNISNNDNYFSINSNIKKEISLPKPLIGFFKDKSAVDLKSEIIINLTNKERERVNLNLLENDNILNDVAIQKLQDMINNNYFEHVSPIDSKDVSYFAKINNYEFISIGENLAMGDFDSEQDLILAWMNSQGHKENILNSNYSHIGVAAQKGNILGRETWISVQVFAKKMPDCQNPDNALKNRIEDSKKQYNFEIIEDLQDEAKKLISQGNDKIKLGNDIYTQTGNYELANTYWHEGTDLYNQGKNKNEEANELIVIYNNLKEDINIYNKQLEQYNKCLYN